jgi:GNAT superfamily N-acetyltransferase
VRQLSSEAEKTPSNLDQISHPPNRTFGSSMSKITLRQFNEDDRDAFLKLQQDAFREIEYLPRVRVGLAALDPDGSIIAERDGSIVGGIGLYKLDRPGWFEISKLAVRDAQTENLASQLLTRALGNLDSKNVQFLKASTPALQPYVDVYKSLGFEPVRRSVRIVWDISKIQAKTPKIETRELGKELADEAADVWIQGLRPFWDYWIEESGGAEELKVWVRQSVSKKTQTWLGAFIDTKLVGLAMIRADSYGPGEARFNGAYALPAFRGRGIGSALVEATIREAQRLNQKTMRVYTLAFLDHLAPGAVLYLKSGGKIEGEFLQLEKPPRPSVE